MEMEKRGNAGIETETSIASEIEAWTATVEDNIVDERTTQTMATGTSALGMAKTNMTTWSGEKGTSGEVVVGKTRRSQISSTLPILKRNFPRRMKKHHKLSTNPWSATPG